MGAEVAGSRSALLIVVVFCCSSISSLDVRLPPSITDPPFESKIYRDDDSVTLNCVASGVPPPEYEWFKDGKILTPHGHSNLRLVGGTLTISPLMAADAGAYQCSAANQHGRAFSPPSVLQRAVGPESSSRPTGFRTVEAERGKPLKIECQPAKCFPKPWYSWALTQTALSLEQISITLDRRIQIDQYGHLHFSYVEASDVQGDKLYKCNVFNPYSDIAKGTSFTKLTLKQDDGSPIQPFGPNLAFSSDPQSIALEGTNVSLRCFFAGFPLPYISWSSESGTILARGRSQRNFDTELLIRNVTQQDKDTYYCQTGGVRHSIHLDVHAVPVFRSIKNRPHDVNVTEGDDVTVVCNAYAVPPANVTWFINGVELKNEDLSPRLQIVDKTRLVLSKVCRDCPDGKSDIKVIQCNASNMHGAAYSSGFINVLKKTEMTSIPVDVTVNSSDTFASFNCSGTSDDSTPVLVKWYKCPDTGSCLPVKEIPPQVVVERNGTLSFLLSNKSSWAEHVGRYNCEVSNGYSVQSQNVQLLTPEESDEPIVVGASIPWWLIFLLISLPLLLLIICCCCYYCLKRNKGATYLVDEKERKNGLNPEKELADDDFKDYVQLTFRKPTVRASSPSLRKSLSDDDLSLNEYGDLDAGKFTEDGSFIGDYNDRPYV